MRYYLIITLLIFSSYFTSYGQTRRSSTTKKVVDKPAESKGKSEVSKNPSTNASSAGNSNNSEVNTSSESFLGKVVKEENSGKSVKSDSKIATNSSSGSILNDTSKKAPAIANTSAIAHGEARTPSAAVAKTYKYKADEKSAEYYTELRKKFDEEEKIKKEKDALLAIEKAKKEEEVKQGRRLSEDQAPQFDKFRQGEKNPVVKKTTAEEDYKSLFK